VILILVFNWSLYYSLARICKSQRATAAVGKARAARG